MKGTKYYVTGGESQGGESEGKNRIRINNDEDDEDDEDDGDFIIDTIGDTNLPDAMLETDDFVDFEATHSDDDVQLHLGFDRGLISTSIQTI